MSGSRIHSFNSSLPCKSRARLISLDNNYTKQYNCHDDEFSDTHHMSFWA
ncbi:MULTISPECIES: hypothetical protein [Helicobacter]|nr:hypothetical protein [Helicobacter sp. UBA3407]